MHCNLIIILSLLSVHSIINEISVLPFLDGGAIFFNHSKYSHMYSIHLHIKMWHFSVKGCMRTCGKELDWSALNRRFPKTHLMFIGRRFHLAGPRIDRVVLCPVIDAKVIWRCCCIYILAFVCEALFPAKQRQVIDAKVITDSALLRISRLPLDEKRSRQISCEHANELPAMMLREMCGW